MNTHICAVVSQKGGVGKTTTVMNLAAALAKFHEKKVLTIDLDAQSNLSIAMGVKIEELEPGASLFDVLTRSYTNTTNQAVHPDMDQAIIHLGNNGHVIDIVPSDKRLANSDIAFAQAMRREYLLKNAIKKMESQYDVILIDCPPNMGLLSLNAFATAKSLLIPVQAEYLSLNGLLLTQDTIGMVRFMELNEQIEILGLLLTFVDTRKKLNRDVVEALRATYGELVFETQIRDNVVLAEAPSNKMDIFEYRSNCYGAWDYKAFAKEFLNRLEEKA